MASLESDRAGDCTPTRPGFVVFALPRSRSAWLASFLTHAGWQCGHDELRHCRSLDDVMSWFAQPRTGTVETAAAPWWRLLPEGVRVVTLRRPVPAVVASLARNGLVFDLAQMTRHITRLDAKLRQIAFRLQNVLEVETDDLVHEETCARVYEFCLGQPHDHAWWQWLAPMNLQVNVHHMARYAAAHRVQLGKLAGAAKHRILAGMRKPAEINGVRFGCERFCDFIGDGETLFAEHGVSWGGDADWQRINLPLLQQLDELGSLHVFTARSNGRLFGYLLSIVGPCVDDREMIVAEQVGFCADPTWRTLGMKTQRAAIEDLRGRGVHRVLMPAHVPKIDAFYRRLGAVASGAVYAMELNPCHLS